MTRDYSYYLDKAKEFQGYKYDNQIDNALGFKASMACILRKGKAHLSEEKMIELANLAGENDVRALMDWAVMRSSGSARSTWERALNQIQHHASSFILAAVTAMIILFSSASAQASNINTIHDSVAKDDLYIITLIKRLLSRVKLWITATYGSLFACYRFA